MQEQLFLKYKELSQRLDNCHKDKIITPVLYEELNKELMVLFPYVNYYAVYEVKINYKFLENKLKIIEDKLKFFIAGKYK